ncbi:hypothetical protein DV737_g3483, partial [Chaetothyriales sp. CBS 132003]
MSQLQPSRGSSAPALKTTTKPRGSVFNPRSLTAPIAAAVMAGLLFTYTITSIRAAKRNAKLHREADGGQVDMRKESLRQHGLGDKVPGTTTYELFRDSRKDVSGVSAESKYMSEGKARRLGSVQPEEVGKPRTEIEAGLEGMRGPAALGKYRK